MAFVLNILHRDFSLLCTDTHAAPMGPRRMAVRRLEAPQAQPASPARVDTLCLNEDASVALGLSGSRTEHAYVAAIESSHSIDDALTLVREYMDEFRTDRGTLLRSTSCLEHSGVLSFFDAHRAAFFSSTYGFSQSHSNAQMTAQHPVSARLLGAGPGLSVFHRIMEGNSNPAFAASVRTIHDVDRCMNWIREVYEAIHLIDGTIGASPIGVLSTRNDPAFCPVNF